MIHAKHFLTSIVILFSLCLTTSTVRAQWTLTNGPVGGSITGIAVNNGAVFAATQGAGVVRSTDAGVTWTNVNAGITTPHILSVTAHGGKLFAGTDGRGVFVTTDNGTTWASLTADLGVAFNSIYRIAYGTAPNGDSVMYAATGGGLYRSADAGAHWALVEGGLPSSVVTSVFARDSVVLAGGNTTMWRSTDYGATWTAFTTGAGKGLVYEFALAGNTIFAARWNALISSTNNGADWSLVTNGILASNVRGLSVMQNPGGGYTVFASCGSYGVYRSTDVGASWTQAVGGMLPQIIYPLANDGTNVYAGGYSSGFYRSTNKGDAWTLNNQGIVNADTRALLAVTNGSTKTVVAGTDGNGISVTTDNGATWSVMSSGITTKQVFCLAAEPNGTGGSNLLAGTNGGGVFLSTNYGTNWTAKNSGLLSTFVNSIATLTISGSTTLYAATTAAVATSTNNGTTWTDMSSGDMANYMNTYAVTAFADNQGHPTIVAGTYGYGLYLSRAGGAWVKISASISPRVFNTVAVNIGALGDTVIYGGTNGFGAFRTSDFGATWTEINSGLTNTDIRSLYVHPNAGGGETILAGTRDGVFSSNNQGSSWTKVNTGIAGEAVSALTESDGNFFAGISAHGTWKRPVGELVTGVEERASGMPSAYSLGQNYPNPFNPSTTISLSLPTASTVTLSLYNVLGQKIAVLVNGEYMNAGYRQIQFDASALSSGVYLYRLDAFTVGGAAGSFTQMKKMLLVR